MAKKVYWSRSESSCITYRFVVVVFEALKLLNILSMIVYVLLLNLSLVFKNPVTFFVIMVPCLIVSLKQRKTKFKQKGTNRPFALRGHVTSFLLQWKLYDFALEKR